jgi:hypothetical protein
MPAAPREPASTSIAGRLRAFLHSPAVLLLAFAFAVMGDPVSSVAYAVEAALRALHGDLQLLPSTMVIVVALIALVVANYHRLVARFPGGGDAAAAGAAFGEGWSFLPLGSLIVDYALTIAVSVAAASSALVAYLPALAGARVVLALALLVAVAGLSWFGHAGRSLFALMTLSFVAVATLVFLLGFLAPHGHGGAPAALDPGHPAPLAVLLAFPVAMALATGVEAPSSAVAQLGQVELPGRVRFGRVTLWLTVAIVSWLTLALTALAVQLHVGEPGAHDTQIAAVARACVGGGVLFALFQLSSAVLLLAAASPSFQAGPGLLKALAGETAVLPRTLARTNVHHTPYVGVLAFLVVAGLLVVAARAHEQELVLFYAVAVFLAFLFGLLSMARFAVVERRRAYLAVCLPALGAVVVTLLVNLARGLPLASLAAALALAGLLWALWVRSGRPRGVSEAEALAEALD